MEDIYAILSNPKGSLFRRYQATHPGISSQDSSYATDDDMGLLSLTSRGPVNWKAANSAPAQIQGTPISVTKANAAMSSQMQGEHGTDGDADMS